MVLRTEGEEVAMPRKCMREGERSPSRSSRYWERRRGSWFAEHYWLDKVIGFFLGYEVRRIEFQRRPINGIQKAHYSKDETSHQGRRKDSE